MSFFIFRKEEKSMITSLKQFKTICFGRNVAFVIEKHYLKPEYTGQKRIVQDVQPNGIYTGILGEPNNELSKVNQGKGIWLEFGRNKDWKFLENGLILISSYGSRVMDIRILD